MNIRGVESAEVNAVAKVTKADGSVEVHEGLPIENNIQFHPYGCLCGGIWLMMKGAVPTACPYCGERIIVQED